MPIKGLTDRGLTFPEIGQIRKGAKKTQDDRPGADLTYFRVEFDEREVETAAKFKSLYGDEPAEIKIVLPFNEIDRQWDAWLEAYTAGRMVARTDGEYFTYLIDTQTGEILVKGGIELKTNLPKPYREGEPVGYGERKPIYCKPIGRLRVIIPELQRAAYLMVLTSSMHDIINISDQLRAFQTLNGGQLAGIPLELRRRPKKISTPMPDGGRARRVKWLISIEADPEWVQRRIAATEEAAMPAALLLEPGDTEQLPTDYDEGEIENGIEDGEYQEPVRETHCKACNQIAPNHKPDCPVTKTAFQEYYNFVYGKLKWTREQAYEVLGQYNDNPFLAIEKAKQQIPT